MLERQLKMLNFSDTSPPPTAQQWQEFLKLIDVAYTELEAKSSQQIQSLDSKLQNIMATAPCIIMWIDTQGYIEGCNEYFQNLMQLKDSPDGKKVSFADLNLQNLQDRSREFIRSASNQISFITQINEFYFKIMFNKMAGQDKISILGFDVTEDINKQNTINQIQAKAVQTSKLAVLGELAAGVAHEINNPLMILTSVAFVVQKNLEQNKYDLLPQKLEKIQSTITRISRIVNGLRTYARDGEDDPMLPTNIADVIIESLELCVESIRYQNIEITFENQLSEPAIIDCRDTQISQVILNLISNAKDAVLQLKEKWIRVVLCKNQKNILIKVIDSGSGIPVDMREQIFKPFFTTKDVKSGTGLGLSISAEIIKIHKGKMYIDASNANTCFTIELPLAD